jgi:hypothetical protein
MANVMPIVTIIDFQKLFVTIGEGPEKQWLKNSNLLMLKY